jgi:hypothetical protein
MNTALFVALPIAMLVSAIVGGLLYFKRNLDTEIQSLSEGCRIIEDLLSRSDSPSVAEARLHLATAWGQLQSAKSSRDQGDRESGFASVDAGYRELKSARELVQHSDTDVDDN